MSLIDPARNPELPRRLKTDQPPFRRHLAALVLGLAGAIAIAGCGSSSTTSTGPSPAKCQVSLAVAPASLAAAGGPGTVSVSTQPECAWTVSTAANWISGLTPTSGQGNGEIAFQAAANPLPAARQGEVVVNDNRVAVAQEAAACVFTISRTTASIGPDGDGDTSVEVAAATGCAWTAASNASWITVTSGATGSGNGSVHVRVAANETAAARVATVTIAGQTFTVTQAAAGCAYTIAPASQAIGAAGGAGTPITVATASACAWTASSSAAWITITSGATGTGNGTVGFTVAANTGAPRTGTLTIAGQTFTVTQAAAGCAYTIAPASQAIGFAGGAGTPVTVATTSACTWTASSNDTWITITSGATGTGNGSVGFTVAANTGAARTGTLTIAGQTFTVTQAAAPQACAYSITPNQQAFAAAGGAGTPIAVATTAACAWTATSNDGWITVTSGATGTGNGSVGFTVATNTGAARTGRLTVAGQTFTVTQAAATVCTYVIAPTTQSIDAPGGAGTAVSVTSPATCAWTAVSNATWITVTAGATGSGNGNVAFTVAANTGAARTGTLTIAGQTFTVTQAAPPVNCAYTIAPTSQSIGAAGGAGSSIAVSTTAPNCAWTAVSNASWLTITSGAAGSGNGSVGFTVAANPGAPRTGTLTIGGQTFTVTQGACSFVVAPLSQTIGFPGGAGTPISVTTAAGCTWSASSGDSWIRITSGATGTGNGEVRFTVDPNLLLLQRQGTLTVAGQTVTVTQRLIP